MRLDKELSEIWTVPVYVETLDCGEVEIFGAKLLNSSDYSKYLSAQDISSLEGQFKIKMMQQFLLNN